MSTKSTSFKINGKEKRHIHLDELPRKIIRKGSTAENNRDEVMRNLFILQYTYEKLLLSAQICYLNIDALTNSKPYMPTSTDTYNSVQDFVYHYENYALRIFILREKVCLFINSVLPVEWPEKDVTITTMLNHTTVKKAKLDVLLKKFNPTYGNALGDLIKNRNQLTHKLYYPKSDHYLRPASGMKDDDEFDTKEWSTQWKKKIKEKEDIITNAAKELMDLNHELSEKVYLYKELGN